jgi:hypothetical protein
LMQMMRVDDNCFTARIYQVGNNDIQQWTFRNGKQRFGCFFRIGPESRTKTRGKDECLHFRW